MSVAYARSASSASSASAPSPVAVRAGRPGWRDPRLVVGLVLVCASTLLGARLLDRADDTVSVLSARGPLAAGQEVAARDVVPVRLRFTSAADAGRYVAGDTEIEPGTVVTREIGAGELVPRDALATDGDPGLLELPLPVPLTAVPASVAAGSLVDVWATRAAQGRRPVAARRLLRAVPVLSTGRASGAVRQVVVGVPESDGRGLSDAVAALQDGSVLLVRRPR